LELKFTHNINIITGLVFILSPEEESSLFLRNVVTTLPSRTIYLKTVGMTLFLLALVDNYV